MRKESRGTRATVVCRRRHLKLTKRGFVKRKQTAAARKKFSACRHRFISHSKSRSRR